MGVLEMITSCSQYESRPEVGLTTQSAQRKLLGTLGFTMAGIYRNNAVSREVIFSRQSPVRLGTDEAREC